MIDRSTVLVVDDAAVDRQIAGSLVEEAGSVAIYAADGRQALEVIVTARPDIVLTDLQMPHLDGLRLVEEIRRTHPGTPVILMTAHGSEDIAAKALRAGATSYVPKKRLKQNLAAVLNTVLISAMRKRLHRSVGDLFRVRESRFELGYETGAAAALVGHLQDGLTQLGFGDDSDLLRIGTALTEALTNAIMHGNLELDSALRDSEYDQYHELGKQRAQVAPYRDRRVQVTEYLTPSEAKYTVRDEGCGFDATVLPDPTDADNLTKPSGRGIVLMRTFMDEVEFSRQGTELTMIKRR